MENLSSNNNHVNGSFINDLVEYIKFQDTIEEAYFAFLYHAEEKKNHLFLGIAHIGNLEEILSLVRGKYLDRTSLN